VLQNVEMDERFLRWVFRERERELNYYLKKNETKQTNLGSSNKMQ